MGKNVFERGRINAGWSHKKPQIISSSHIDSYGRPGGKPTLFFGRGPGGSTSGETPRTMKIQNGRKKKSATNIPGRR